MTTRAPSRRQASVRKFIRWTCAVGLAYIWACSSSRAAAQAPTEGPPAPVAAAPLKDAATPVTVQSILERWNRREQIVDSSIFTWTEQRTHVSDFLASDERRAEPFTPNYDVDGRLSFDGERLRYSYKKSLWKDADAPAGGDEFVSVFNGRDSKVYFPPGYVSEYPRGHFSSQSQSEGLDALYLKPMLWTFRPSLPDVMLFPPADGKLQPSTRDDEHLRDCVELTYTSSPGHVNRLWLDPKQDYSIVFATIETDEQLTLQVEVTYTFDNGQSLWIPATWKLQAMFVNNAAQLLVNGTMEKHNINPVLPASEFEFDFPVGTWVHEGANIEYLVTEDGSNPHIARSDRNTPYAELRHGGGISTTAAHWLFWANVALVCAISTYLLVRWQQWKRSIPQ